MATQNISTTTFRSSFLLTFLAASLIVLTISCSDITDEDGITNNEFQQAQSQMTAQATGDQPLYVINGEIISESEVDASNALSRIKSKYISSINILKGQNAIDAYGKSGQNGVVQIQLADGINKEIVFSDLKETSASLVQSKTKSQEDFFVAVEKMPELKGGLQALMTQLNYPEEAFKAGEEGRVTVSFIVNKQGNVEDPQIIRGVSKSLDQEALRVVKQAKFIPGQQRGKPVRVQYALPISFKLPDGSSNNGS